MNETSRADDADKVFHKTKTGSSEHCVLLSHGMHAQEKSLRAGARTARCDVHTHWAISAHEYTTSASLATRATNWMRMTATSCARTHLLAHSLPVSPSLVNVRIEIVGAAAAAIAFRIAAGNAVYTACQGS